MDEERRAVVDILDSAECKFSMSEDFFRLAKDNKASTHVRQQGNTRFQQSRHHSGLHEDILNKYSLAALIAYPRSEELAIAYGNRSAMMIHLCMYEDCIKEIDRALHITNNNLFKLKLLCRKARCLNALKLNGKKVVMHKAETLLNQLKNDPSAETFTDLVNKTKLSLDVPVRHKNVSVRNDKKSACVDDLHEKHKINDFSVVDVQYNEQYGRHLVAKRDINLGEIIFIEKPYQHILAISREYTYCSHCLIPCLINIPCEHCAWGMYCSEECKQQAWTNYHDLECYVFAMIRRDIPRDGIKHLIVKSLICGIREAGGIDQLRDELKAFDSCTDKLKGFVKEGKIQSNGFKSICALLSNTSDKAENVHRTNTILILRAIAKSTTYFGKRPDYEKTKEFPKDDNVLFLGSLVYKLSKIFQLNSHIIPSARDFCGSGLDARLCEKQRCCTTGFYIAPITSLLNHSCIPNVKRCFSNNYSVIVYAVQPIKKGSQLFDCYQQEFYEYDISPRQKHLTKTYNFKCDCTACNEKWDIVEYEVVSEKNLKKHATESQLADEYLQLIKAIHDNKIKLSEKHIDILTRAIKKANQSLSQPSFMLTNLIRALNVVFKRLYGLEMKIPDKCNNV